MKPQLALLGTGALLAMHACSSTERAANTEVQNIDPVLSNASAQALASNPAVRDELAAVLTEYFGEANAPRFAVLDEWEERGFDPNGSPLEGGRPADDLAGGSAREMEADNRRVWASELAVIAAGSVEGVGPWPRRRGMNRAWRELEAQRDSLDAAEFSDRATAFFVEHYPTLGESAEMYVPNCSRCHGRDGSGNGRISDRLSPRPRNLHHGVFKFAAVESGSKPRLVDLVRTLERGLPGTQMPGFPDLSLAELGSMAAYVRYVSIRGEVESLMVWDWMEEGLTPRESVADLYGLVWQRWLEAADLACEVTAPAPDRDPARLALGDAVFRDEQRGNCMSCHGSEGRGDGPSAYCLADDGSRVTLLLDSWGDVNLPHDLTDGLFRGGNRREDVYTRIHCGIPGTPMPALGPSRNAEGEPLLSEEEKWAVVDFVLSLSGQGPFATQ